MKVGVCMRLVMCCCRLCLGFSVKWLVVMWLYYRMCFCVFSISMLLGEVLMVDRN